jgi:hypothetical protein
MGFYDCRCMITGVSLKGSDAALVLLQGGAEAWVPIACAIKGNYNRLGAIDGIDEDANTEAILGFFLSKLKSGDFVVDASYLREFDYYPIGSIERLLAAFERNINDHPGAAVLHGQPVVFALICRAVWDAIAQAFTSSSHPTNALIQRTNIYGNNLASVATHAHELSAVHNFLMRRKLAWQPAQHPEQHYREEMIDFLANGKRTFSDSPVVLEGLAHYERAVAELLRPQSADR